MKGLWYGMETTPVPSLMCLVTWAVCAMNSIGSPIGSTPQEWCSPNQASSKPMRSSS